MATDECNASFWYSRQAAIALLASSFLLVQSISYLIPPFQSPDEFNHLKRAYLLSRGEIFLDNNNGHTGGNVDTGLLEYMGYFGTIPLKYEKKITAPGLSLSRKVAWTGKRQFSDLPNTAIYFPLPYIPQALALIAGEQTGLSVSDTYYLARILSLLATLGLLWVALIMYPVPLFVVALFVTPMTLFQLASASLDSVSFATSALAASLFMRGSDLRLSFSPGMHIALAVCLFSLATSRINLMVLTPLPAVLYTIRSSRSFLVSSVTVVCLSSAWIVFALRTVQGMPTRELTTGDIIKFYLKDPASLIHVLFASVTNVELLRYYWNTFIGVLGSMDTPLDSTVYLTFGALFTTLALISLQRDKACLFNRGNLFLFCSAAASLLVLFPILLVTWTPHPATVVWGMQGRYFTPILIFLGFAIFSRRLSLCELKIGLSIALVMVALSIMSMAPTLLSRYWISESEHPPPSLAGHTGLPQAREDRSLARRWWWGHTDRDVLDSAGVVLPDQVSSTVE